jgi:hypothetical protein
VLKTIRNIILTVVILLAITVGAGVAYVLFTGKDISSDSETSQPDTTPDIGLPKPHQPSPNAPESAGIEAFNTPVKAGENSSLSVKTLPSSNCVITVTYKDVPSKDSGLAPKTADDYGNVSWSWTVDKTAPAGKWPVKVTCMYNKKSAVVIGDLVVTN